MTKRGAAIWMVVFIVITMTAAVLAQPRDPAAEAQTIFRSVMSPYCPGLLLADCPSPAAFDLRADILRRLKAGESASDIERDLYRKFGSSIRAVPPARGSGRWLWIAPAIGLVLSFGALLWFLAQSRAEDEPPPIAADPDTEARLQEDLERMS